MIRHAATLAFFLLSTRAIAQDMPGMQMDAAPGAGDAQIVVTINPEAKVSATIQSGLSPRALCGSPVVLRVKVINQGGITAQLQTQLIDPPSGVMLHWQKTALSGNASEQRELNITSDRSDATDVTIAFSLTGAPGDLADRDRVHLLLDCKVV